MPEKMVQILVYHKVCSLWVPHFLTEWHRLQGKNVFLTIAGSVCCQRRWHSSWHRDGW